MKKKLLAALVASILVMGGTLGIEAKAKDNKVDNSYENTIVLSNKSTDGWVSLGNGTWKYLVDNVPQIGWIYVEGQWYYTNSNGVAQSGWLDLNGTWYYLDGSGAMQTGWVQSNGSWYYMNSSGAMQTGWANVNGTWYYMNSSGVAQSGWLDLNGTWYYLDGSGAMQTGWIHSYDCWYYMDSSGAMQTGWNYVDGEWYYMNNSGVTQSGWREIDNQWYYLDGSGAMQTGWLDLNGTWYYLNSSGAMLTGTHIIDGQTYYFSDSGAMQEQTKVIEEIIKYEYLGGRIKNQKCYIYGTDVEIISANEIKTKMIFQDNMNKLYDIRIKDTGDRVEFTVYNSDGSVKNNFAYRPEFINNQNGEGLVFTPDKAPSNDMDWTYLQGTDIEFASGHVFSQKHGLYKGILPDGQEIEILIARGTQILFDFTDFDNYRNINNNVVLMSYNGKQISVIDRGEDELCSDYGVNISNIKFSETEDSFTGYVMVPSGNITITFTRVK